MLDYTSYIMGMNTFDELSQAIRTGSRPSHAGSIVRSLLLNLAGGVLGGVGIILGLSIGLAIAHQI